MLFDTLDRIGLTGDSLRGQVAVVTGAGRGIGRETARALAHLGAAIAVVDLAASADETTRLVVAEGGRAHAWRTDVSRTDDVEALALEVGEQLGPVDILVNNAITIDTGPISGLPIEAWDRAYAVNLRGSVLCIRAFLPEMLRRRTGVIVQMVSTQGIPFAAPYSASKVGCHSLVQSLAAEIGDGTGVSVFAFAPGMVDTPGGRQSFSEIAPHLGMTYEEFVSQGVNPGYEGLVPAEDCAAGLAHAVVHAGDHHGEDADPFGPLLGSRGRGATDDPSARAVIEILEQQHVDFEGIPALMRRFAVRDFAAKTGMTIDQWTAMIGRADIDDDWADRLERLARYFEDTAAGLHRWIRDPDDLREARRELARRAEVVRSIGEGRAGVPGDR